MKSFIIFGQFTQQGAEKVKNVTECVLEMKVMLTGVGGDMRDIYYTLGRYDFVAFIEAPDEKAMLKAMMEIAKIGNMKTETLVAIPAEEAKSLIKG